jgi:putative nucleotidyltransferase with HDIG domain
MRTSNVFATKVGTRVLLLFFVGAIVPVGILAFLSHRAVTRQLLVQSEARLAEETRTARQLALERLSNSVAWVQDAAESLPDGSDLPPSSTQRGAGVSGMGIYVGSDVRGQFGTPPPVPELTQAETARLADGGLLLKTLAGSQGPEVLLASPTQSATERVAWARIRHDSLWSSALTLASDPALSNLCFTTAERVVFACTQDLSPELTAGFDRLGEDGLSDGAFEFEGPNGTVKASWRMLFLRSSYDAPPWYVVATQERASVLAPVQGFTINLLAALAVALGLVLLMAHFLVERTMSPLARLTEGTRSLAVHDLSARVELDVDDEFGDLAGSFNTMASKLEKQFKQLRSAQAIDGAVLRDRDHVGAAGALLEGVEAMLPVTGVALLLFDVGRDGSDRLFRRDVDGSLLVESRMLDASQLEWVPKYADWVPNPGNATEALAPTGMGQGFSTLYAIPMVVQSERVGVVVASSTPAQDFDPDDLGQAETLVGRGAVALNEVRLRQELRETSEDALEVLANAIDAKSRWTAGHSLRVTALADAIGLEMQLDGSQRDVLHRGGLLHDIGKIGVPLEILDFPGHLTEEMFDKIQEHPQIGATILNPMKVFRPLIPIVLHHHEKWNGKGYPHGLAGQDIPMLARILAVADVFDAMITPRPYRDALDRDFVVSHIEEGSGAAFDPKVVQAFQSVMRAGWVHDEVVLDLEVSSV